jgi:hypothetical protein
MLRSLYYSSFTPVLGHIKEQSYHAPFYGRQSGRFLINSGDVNVMTSPYVPSNCPPSYFPALAASNRALEMGLCSSDYDYIIPLSEFSTQSLVSATISTQREFLCLTKFGLCIIHKNRPIDYLIKILALNDYNEQAFITKIANYINAFGAVQTLGMCLEIYCNMADCVSHNLVLGEARENIVPQTPAGIILGRWFLLISDVVIQPIIVIPVLDGCV